MGGATTGTGDASTTGPVTVVPPAPGDSFVLTESATPGTATALDAYEHSWACTNSALDSTTVLPTGSGTSKEISPRVGDAITCTITNTPVVDLHVTKNAAPDDYVPGVDLTYTVRVTKQRPVARQSARK